MLNPKKTSRGFIFVDKRMKDTFSQRQTFAEFLETVKSTKINPHEN